MQYVPPLGAEADAAYVDAQPALGIEGSVVPAAAIEHPQREILDVIEAAELEPDGATLTQLRAAIMALAGAEVGAHATRTDNPHAVTAAQALAVPLAGPATLTGAYAAPPLALGEVATEQVQLTLGARSHQSVTVTHAAAVFADPADLATWPGGEVRLWLTMGPAAAFVGHGVGLVEQYGSCADMLAGRTYLVHLLGQGDGQLHAYIEEVL
ncbi:hypothetical protein [Desulfocurvus vexinensis]|uniref:hypothetical protein n=1 Tax=Desulfocurvus vexinensis TaxID=399548 RepID=UPI00048DD794|nr:hypothetical protein [Desulfocurvus vexinensis]